MAAVPHADRRGVADRAAAGQQRGPHRGRGAGRGARRHQLAAHQRPRRDARAAHRRVRRDRPAHPAGADGGDRRDQRGRPARRLLVRRGAHRPDRGRGRGDLRPDPRTLGHDGSDDRRHPARHRGRLVHRPRSPRPRSPTSRRWRRARRRSSGSTCTPARSPRSWRSCGSRTRSSWSSGGCSPRAGPTATTDGCERRWTRMVAVARTDENMIPAMLDAARAEATLGEICDALRGRVGHLPGAGPLLTAAAHHLAILQCAGTKACTGWATDPRSRSGRAAAGPRSGWARARLGNHERPTDHSVDLHPRRGRPQRAARPPRRPAPPPATPPAGPAAPDRRVPARPAGRRRRRRDHRRHRGHLPVRRCWNAR